MLKAVGALTLTQPHSASHIFRAYINFPKATCSKD